VSAEPVKEERGRNGKRKSGIKSAKRKVRKRGINTAKRKVRILYYQ